MKVKLSWAVINTYGDKPACEWKHSYDIIQKTIASEDIGRPEVFLGVLLNLQFYPPRSAQRPPDPGGLGGQLGMILVKIQVPYPRVVSAALHTVGATPFVPLR